VQIETVLIDDLDLDPRNARKHDEKNLKAIAGSLELFGQRKPIVVWGRTVVAGNGTLVAARSLGWKEITVARVPDDWSSDQVKAYALADNRSAELAVWDEQVLASQLLELTEAEFDVELLGFEIPVEPLQDVVEDEIPEQVEPKSKLGDVWKLGRHKLMCGDSTDTATVQKLMDGYKADLVFTDPPYGMFLDADYSDMSSKFKGSSGGNKYDAVIGDNADFTPDLITSVLANFDYVNEIFLWGADYYSELLPNKNQGSWIVWDKRGDESADKMFGSTFEMCWSKARHKRDIARIKWAGIFGMEKEHDKKRQHPTQKPVALSAWFFEKWAKGLKNVVDVYGGSGSTLLACEQTDRTCFMMELDPKYVDVIIARWEKFTGQTAELIEG
jgi:site-specific DNA-methyltransferase (adenine-specific)